MKSSSSPSCFLKTLAVILAVGFVKSAAISLLLFNVEIVFFHAGTYEHAFLSQQVYQKIPRLAAEQIIHSITFNPCAADASQCEGEGGQPAGGEESGGPPIFMKNLSVDGWERLIGLILPEGWAQEQTESFLDEFFRFVRKPGEDFNPSLSLLEIHQNMDANRMREISELFLSAAPACSDADLALILAISLGQSEETVPICMPSTALKPFLLQEMEAGMRNLIAELPNEISMNPPEAQEPAATPAQSAGLLGDDPRRTLQILRFAFLLSPLLPIALLVLIALCAVRSWNSLLRWWGWPLLVAGFVVLPLLLLLKPASSWFFDNFIASLAIESFTPGILSTILAILQAILGRYALWVGIESGLFFVAGTGLLLLSLIIKPPKASPSYYP